MESAVTVPVSASLTYFRLIQPPDTRPHWTPSTVTIS